MTVPLVPGGKEKDYHCFYYVMGECMRHPDFGDYYDKSSGTRLIVLGKKKSMEWFGEKQVRLCFRHWRDTKQSFKRPNELDVHGNASTDIQAAGKAPDGKDAGVA